MRTPIWDKAQAADVSAYAETIYAAPLAKFVAHMVKEGQQSEHTPEYVARQVELAISYKGHAHYPDLQASLQC